MNAPAIPGILSSEQVEQGAARWLELLEAPDSTALGRAFESQSPIAGPATSPRLQALHLPLQQLVRLVSTVGLTRIKASFVALPDAGGTPRFAVVLSTSNDLGARASSYYLAAAYPLPAADADQPGPADQPAALALGATPGVLARTWRRLWRQEGPLTPALFASGYGYLRGYTFAASDFVAALAGVQTDDQGSLVVHFGLHEYYRPDPAAGDVLARTFGLILQLRNALKDQVGGDDGGDPFYDMAAPCPPSC